MARLSFSLVIPKDEKGQQVDEALRSVSRSRQIPVRNIFCRDWLSAFAHLERAREQSLGHTPDHDRQDTHHELPTNMLEVFGADSQE